MSRTRTRTRPRRLALNTLEDRSAPAAQLTASFDYADRVLRIEGTDGPDVIRVVNNAGQVRVAGLSIRSTNSGPVWTNVPAIAAADIGYIDVRALAGNDRVEVAELNIGPALAVRMSVHGQQGHDTLNGGSAADGLYGGTGNDVINGNGGADHIEGGFSSDVVSAQAVQLDRDLGLYYGSDNNYAFENSGGRGEKYLYGTNPDAGYFILPSGELYRMDYTLQPAGADVPALVDEAKEFYGWVNPEVNYAASGTLIATLDPSYHQNMVKLVNASVLAGAPLNQDPLGPRAAQLDGDLGLAVEGEEDLYGGQRERWLLDGRVPYDDLQASDNYFILPNGELYRWDGNPDVLGGTLIATLDSSYYQDLTRLTDAQYLFGNPEGVPIAAWYAGEGNTTDATGGNDGTASGNVAYGPGRIGQAFQLSGFDNPGYVRVPNAPELEPSTVSVEAWVNSSVLQTYGYIVSKGAADFRGASYALVTSLSQGLWFYVGDGGAFAYSPDPGTGIWDGNWHHVVGTYDGSFVRLYVDGTEIGEGSRLDGVLGYGLPDTNDLFIGTYNAVPGYTFTGRIDEPTVYGRALNASEVRALYAGGKAALPTTDAGDNDTLTGGAGNDTAIGGDGSDSLTGGLDNDRLVGGNDNDTLSGNQGNDELVGCHVGFAGEVGNPNDSIWGGAGNDSLYGGDGADVLAGHDGNDYFRGDGGNDRIYGGFQDLTSETGAANDTAEGGDGSDSMYGGAGDDTLIGQNDNDWIQGGRGNDTLIGCFLGWAGEAGNANDTVFGENGSDRIFGGDGDDNLSGGNDNDDMYGDGGNDSIWGAFWDSRAETGNTNDTVYGGDGSDSMYGGFGNDNLSGGNDNDDVHGDEGNDAIWGAFWNTPAETGNANDTLTGGHGSDTIEGGQGNDNIDGGLQGPAAEVGAMNDLLDGGEGNDLLWGGEGNDSLTGSHGADTLNGEAGVDDLDGGLRGFDPEVGFSNDTLDGGPRGDLMWGGEGEDSMTGGLGQDTLNGESGRDILDGGLPGTESEGTFGSWDLLDGGTEDDLIWGGEGFDTLFGGEGNDTLIGEAGADRMFGQGGNDILYGRGGRDTLDGGFGQDGLFGGTQDARDDLFGGPDPDRILSADDNDLDRAPEDALLHFFGVDTAQFTDAEIELMDRGLGWLQAVRGNPALLKLPDQRAIRIQRVFALEDGMADNDNDGRIRITDVAFDTLYRRTGMGTNAVPADATIIHELGHNWDGDFDEDDGIEAFIEDNWFPLSGWDWRWIIPEILAEPQDPGQSISDDGNWYYNTSAPFARAYGRDNPTDDWCTTWEAYYVRGAYANTSREFSVYNFTAAMDPKFAVVQRFFDANF